MWFIFILIQTESGHPTNQPTITYVLSVQVLNLFSFHFHRLVLCSFLLDALWVDVARNDVAKWKYFMQQKMISKFIFRFSFHFSTMSSKFSVVFFPLSWKFALVMPARAWMSIRPTILLFLSFLAYDDGDDGFTWPNNRIHFRPFSIGIESFRK